MTNKELDERLESIVDGIYKYGKWDTGTKKLIDYVDELKFLFKKERGEVLRTFFTRISNKAIFSAESQTEVDITLEVQPIIDLAIDEFLSESK